MSDSGFRPAAYASLTSDDLVTGEAVALDLPPANLGHRLISGLIDVIVTMVAFLVMLFLALAATARTDAALMRVGAIAAQAAVFIAIPTTVETLTRGRSLGRLAMGLRVVRDDAGPISFQHAFVRALVGFVEIYALTGAPALFSVLVSSRGKRLGDYAAGTYVVRERVPLLLDRPILMPPHLAGWAATADLTPLPTGLALAVRQFLGRWHQIEPASRYAQSASLAEQVREYVAPPPPPGTPAEMFLAAVLAGRRDRDTARLAREGDRRARLLGRR